MQQAWLRPNRRALWLGTVPPLAVAALRAWVAFGLGGPNGGWTCWLGWPLLASWQAGCVTLHGTRCEPLSASLVRRLNERLHAVTTPLDAGDGAPP